MTDQELAEKYEKFTIQYDVTMDREKTKTVISKGQSVSSDALIKIIWSFVPACYLNMHNKEGDNWQNYANYFRTYITKILKRNDFWTDSLKPDYIDGNPEYTAGKTLSINAVEKKEETGTDVALIFRSDIGLFCQDYVYGICSIVKQTYTDLCYEDNTAAKWLKNSICEMVDMDSFWEDGEITETEMEYLKDKYASKPKLLS